MFFSPKEILLKDPLGVKEKNYGKSGLGYLNLLFSFWLCWLPPYYQELGN